MKKFLNIKSTKDHCLTKTSKEKKRDEKKDAQGRKNDNKLLEQEQGEKGSKMAKQLQNLDKICNFLPCRAEKIFDEYEALDNLAAAAEEWQRAKNGVA